MNNLKDFDLKYKQQMNVNFVCGMDETGRGSMVSSLVAACVVLREDYYNPKVNDSKKLSENQLLELEAEIKLNSVFYKIVEYDNFIIDSKGIQLVNINAFCDLKKEADRFFSNILYLVDGNIMKSCSDFVSVVKGDSKSFSIACASILAKTFRDKKMIELSKEFPEWQLEKNKGYGQDYINLVKQHGFPENIHRFSYKIKNDKQIKLF